LRVDSEARGLFSDTLVIPATGNHQTAALL